MPRIPEADLEKLKRDISVQQLAESRGVILRKKGDELLGLCPFHEDHSPSLIINPTKNIWHCLGACQTGGSVIDWVMKAEALSFRDAAAYLRKRFLPLVADNAACETDDASSNQEITITEIDEQRALAKVIDYYHTTLKQSPEALEYLSKRGIASSEAIDQFRLGYSNRTLTNLFPPKNSEEGSNLRAALLKTGIIRDTGHELFRGSFVIPVIDQTNRITEVYGRKIRSDLRKGTPLHLYLPGPHRGVWNEPALMASSEIILCESLIDALTFWCAGYRNVTASYGVEGFTSDHMIAFKQYGIERVLIAYDRDEAGDRAAAALSKKLKEEGIESYRILFPHNMDANEFALSVKPAEKSLGIVIRKAIGVDQIEQIGNEIVVANDIRSGSDRDQWEATKGGNSGSEDETLGAPSEAPRNVLYEDPDISACQDKAQMASDPAGCASALPASLAAVAIEDKAALPQQPCLIQAEQRDGEIRIVLGDRRWRVRGLEKNMSFEQMRINLLVSKEDTFYVDTFDLYNARHRQLFLKQASDELVVKDDVLKHDLGKILLKLEELQERQISRTLERKEPDVTMSEKDRAAAMEFLKAPDLLNRVLNDFEKCGIVGEHTNKLVGYLAAVSRKLEEPLAIVIQSSSAAGKSSLMEAILSFMPSEEQVKYSAMTGQSLFYMGESDLKHKILAIVEEEGAERASYALKLLQSEGELTIASTGKDPATGRLVTQEYRVQGPVMIFLTTTAIEIDEELLNRCIVLTVDEDREQTRAIHRLQRERQTLEGLLARQERGNIRAFHQNAQRLLEPLLVANPFANELTFLDNQTRTRRDHMKYLTLIRAIALLHQHQRPIKRVSHQGKTVSYIDVELRDIEIANRLAHEVLGRSLDELAPQTRRLLILLNEMVTKRCKELAMERCDYRFSRREVREYTNIGDTRLAIHMNRLQEMEYLIAHRGGRGQQFVYELAYNGEGQDGASFVSMLFDVTKCKKYDRNFPHLKTDLPHLNDDLPHSKRPHFASISPPFRPHPHDDSLNDSEKKEPINGNRVKNAHLDEKKLYVTGRTYSTENISDEYVLDSSIKSYNSEVQ
jgi:DNA primase catalytic core